MSEVPKALEKMVDIVLSYRPESKVKPPKPRKKKSKPEATETKEQGT